MPYSINSLLAGLFLSALPVTKASAESFLVVHRGLEREFYSLASIDSLAWDSLGTPSTHLLLFTKTGKSSVPFAGIDSMRFVEAKTGPKLATITVASGTNPRVNTPVSVGLNTILLQYPAALLRLEELQGVSRFPVPVQVAADLPGDVPKLWFIPPGRAEAGTTRTFELSCLQPAPAESLSLNLNATTMDIRWGASQVLSYNHALIPGPAGSGPEFLRSGYIHPIYSPTGAILSEDAPPDHGHHRALFLAWVQTKFEGHSVNFWELGAKQGTVRFTSFGSMTRGPVFSGFQAHHQHVDLTQPGGKVALDEDWNVRAWKVGGPTAGYWLWDLTSVQRCASTSPLTINNYYFGGLGLRAAKEWKGDKLSIKNSAGIDTNAVPARWTSAAGEVGGSWRRVSILSHPSNHGHPEPSMAFPELAFTGFHPALAADWTMTPGQQYVLRYRFFVEEGVGSSAETDRVWQDFGNPPITNLTPESALPPTGIATRVNILDKAGATSTMDLGSSEALRFSGSNLQNQGKAIPLSSIRVITLIPTGVSILKPPKLSPVHIYRQKRDVAGRVHRTFQAPHRPGAF